MGFMYILLCADGTFYAGSTRDIAIRFRQHQRGEGEGSAYVSMRLPVRLVYYEEYELVADAFEREQQVKRMLRGQKRKLVANGWGVRPANPADPFPWVG